MNVLPSGQEEPSNKANPAPARIGIGGPVGSGKTALIERLIPSLEARGLGVGVVTNDLVTREDAERLRGSGLIAPERVLAVETGACPHTAIREDPTMNLLAIDSLVTSFPDLSVILLESGGDNLASTFSLDLVDYWLFVIDTAGGDDIPRKKGPGIVRSDLLVINKTDLAPLVGVNLKRMIEEALAVRGGKPVLTTNCATGDGIDAVVARLSHDVLFDG
ncbi:MAG: urease accessory protein UreG [Alphaproteobacteria bacterium]|jgi:urease accessory protein